MYASLLDYFKVVVPFAIVVLIGLGMPLVIFLLRENIKEIRQGIITDLAQFFESPDFSTRVARHKESRAAPPRFEVSAPTRTDKRHSARFCANVGGYEAGEPKVPAVVIGTVTRT